MLRKLLAFVVCLVAAVATASAQTPPYNEIWYTTTDGEKISFNANNLVSNSYNNGRGVLKFQNRVTSIKDKAFYDCSILTSITIPNSVTSIGESAFNWCNNLKSITIPNSVKSIGEMAFHGCISLTSINIPDSVTSIGGSAFAYCKSLTSITIPNGVTYIGYEAFKDCISLTSITIPNNVTSIGNCAFLGCSSLTGLVYLASTPPAIGNIGISETTMIFVPKKAVKAYKKDPNWIQYKKQIKPIK